VPALFVALAIAMGIVIPDIDESVSTTIGISFGAEAARGVLGVGRESLGGDVGEQAEGERGVLVHRALVADCDRVLQPAVVDRAVVSPHPE